MLPLFLHLSLWFFLLLLLSLFFSSFFVFFFCVLCLSLSLPPRGFTFLKFSKQRARPCQWPRGGTCGYGSAVLRFSHMLFECRDCLRSCTMGSFLAFFAWPARFPTPSPAFCARFVYCEGFFDGPGAMRFLFCFSLGNLISPKKPVPSPPRLSRRFYCLSCCPRNKALLFIFLLFIFLLFILTFLLFIY